MAYGGSGEDALEDDESKLIVENTENALQKSLDSDNITNTEQCSDSDKYIEDCINYCDSLSSSASISDSDLTSTDSEDSLALSESDSITDVTPLNSPYCDSPLPQCKSLDHKSDDKNVNASHNLTKAGCPPEINVLIKAIEKLETEEITGKPSAKVSSVKRRTISCGEDSKKVEQENQKLFKRVISQQTRMKAQCSSTSQICRKVPNIKHTLVKSDGDISVLPKSVQPAKSLREGGKHAQRQQKCLSHPASSFSCTPLIP